MLLQKSKDKNKLKDYPFNNNWEVIISQPQWLQTHLHEFLLKRIMNVVYLLIFIRIIPTQTLPSIMNENILKQDDWFKFQNIINFT